MKTKHTFSGKQKIILIMVLISMVLLGAGFLTMQTLAGMKTTPAIKPVMEQAIPVETKIAKLEEVTPEITGYGEVKSIEVVALSSEIGGKVVEIHPELEDGKLVEQGELLVRIDTSDDEISLEYNKERLKALQRNLELANHEFQRMQKLNKKNNLVPLSDVEQSEQSYNAMADQVSQLKQAISQSQLNIERAKVFAPFKGRIKSVSVEKGQYISPGSPITTLVNDSLLEIYISIDSSSAIELLPFNENDRSSSSFWFAPVKPVQATLTWTQGTHSVKVGGFLDRIIAFDPLTRTLKLAVRLDKADGKSFNRFPIVEGMFCKVSIPGNTIDDVIKLPRQSVDFENKVHIVVNNRLKTVPVEVKWMEEDSVYVSSGIEPNDQVIVTRLSDPLENSLVDPRQADLIASKDRRQK